MSINSIKKSSDFTAGYAGSIDQAQPSAVFSAPVVLSASQEYTPGRPLVRDGDKVRPTTVGDVLNYGTFAGFGVRDATKPAAYSYSGGQQYQNGDAVNYLVLGSIKVVAGGAVVAGQSVVCQVNGGALTSVSHTGSLSTGQFRIPGAVWTQSAGSGAVTTIFVNAAVGALSFSPVGVSGSNI